MGKELTTTIIKNAAVANDIFEMRLQTEANLTFTPGQFANVGVPSQAQLLKRPFSINTYDKTSGEMTIIYKVVGKGTAELSQMKAGEPVEIVAPLGKGFPTLKDSKRVFLVGGGIGCAPLESVMDAFPNSEYHAFLGFDTKASIYHQTAFAEKSEHIAYATMDGTHGINGLVTEPLSAALKDNKPDILLACGPTPMLKALKDMLAGADFPVYISVEERMGCGMGGCAVCVCKTTEGYKKACVEGPVFALSEVVFDG